MRKLSLRLLERPREERARNRLADGAVGDGVHDGSSRRLLDATGWTSILVPAAITRGHMPADLGVPQLVADRTRGKPTNARLDVEHDDSVKHRRECRGRIELGSGT